MEPKTPEVELGLDVNFNIAEVQSALIDKTLCAQAIKEIFFRLVNEQWRKKKDGTIPITTAIGRIGIHMLHAEAEECGCQLKFRQYYIGVAAAKHADGSEVAICSDTRQAFPELHQYHMDLYHLDDDIEPPENDTKQAVSAWRKLPEVRRYIRERNRIKRQMLEELYWVADHIQRCNLCAFLYKEFEVIQDELLWEGYLDEDDVRKGFNNDNPLNIFPSLHLILAVALEK